MCNCIDKLQKDLIGKIINRKKVVKAKLKSSFLIVGPTEKETHSEIEIEFEDQKKKLLKPVAHFYCPICGVKYPEGTPWKTIG